MLEYVVSYVQRLHRHVYWGSHLPLQPITDSPPKWMAELENEDIDMLKGTHMYALKQPFQTVEKKKIKQFNLFLDDCFLCCILA